MDPASAMALQLLEQLGKILRRNEFDLWPTAALKLTLSQLLGICERISDELDERGGL